MTRKPAIAVLGVLLILLASSATLVHAFYVADLPQNVIYADDFENYTTTTCTASVSGTILTGCLQGWNFYDNDAGGVRGINQTNVLSPSHALYLQDSTATSGKFDIDRRFGNIANSTRLVTLSVWFAFPFTITNRALNNIHIAVEAWDKVNHYESLIFFYYQSTPACVEPDLVIGPGSVDNVVPYCLEPWTHPTQTISGYWHHVIIQADILNYKWVDAQVDGMDFAKTVQNQQMRVLADNSQANYNPPFGFRVEFATQNAATHTTPTDTFWAWFDDMIVTDSTLGGPNPLFAGFGGLGLAWVIVFLIAPIFYMIARYTRRSKNELSEMRKTISKGPEG